MAERKEVDARGMACPGPLIALISALKTVEVGDEVEVLSTDRGSNKDIATWLNKAGHQLVESEQLADHIRFLVRKLR
ncbi:MAG: sulfurtransferase TusA family protein [Nitrospirae bacterium]|nr:sulfurtransferase TusA family protein [Nitrospirota bacterium]